MKRRLRITGGELRDGDTLTRSDRYGYRVRGNVVIASRAGELTFLEAPTLPDEDVAFRAGDRVEVLREATP